MDYVLTLAIVQGLFLIFVFVYKRFSDKRTVKLLLWLLGLTIVILFGRASYQPEFLLKYWAFVSLPDALLFLFGPLAYFLTRSIMKMNLLSKKELFFHFLPALFHALVLNIILGLIIIDKMPYMNYKHLVVMYQVIEAAGIVSIASYLVCSHRTFVSNKGYYTSNYSSTEAPFFLKRFFVFQFVLVVFWSISYGAKLMGIYDFMDYRFYHMFWIAVSFSIYLLTFYFLLQPEFLNLPEVREKEAPVLLKKTFSLTKSELDSIMLKGKHYMDSDLTLDKLAMHCNMSRNELSAAINDLFAKNFFDFVNGYRIDAFVKSYPDQKVEDTATTFIEVAYAVGFNSKSSFNRAFKKHFNQTPSSFFKEVKVDKIVG